VFLKKVHDSDQNNKCDSNICYNDTGTGQPPCVRPRGTAARSRGADAGGLVLWFAAEPRHDEG
jgi:hypothetical protein